jgi:hypothetical protein
MSPERNDFEDYDDQLEGEDPATEVFACPDCEAVFDSEGELAAHRQLSHHAIVTSPVRCPSCDLEFLTLEQLNEHGRREHPASSG